MVPKNELLHPEILANIIASIEAKGYRDITVELSAGSVKGDNYLGEIVKAVFDVRDVRGNNVQLQRIIKISSQNDEFRAFTHVDKIFGREAYMYDVVLPELVRFQREVTGLDPSDVFDSFPTAHYTCVEPYREAIVMEDMKQKGFIMRDRKVPLDLKHSIKVLEAYGRLHAISFAMRDQKPVEFQRLADNLHESWFHDLRKVPFQKLLNGHNELGLSSIKDCNNENALNLYKDYTEHTYDRLMASIHPKAAGNFAVIGHGDSWINNILFKYEDDESFPDKLCLLDFQLSRIGSPSLDLSYFIFTCTDRDLRCEHFDTLLRSYHDSLFKHIRLLGSDPEALYPYDVLLDHMRRFSVFGLMMTGMVLHVMMSDKDEIPDTRQQSTDQMIDSMSFKSSNEHKIKHRLRDVILDMAEKGYLDNA